MTIYDYSTAEPIREATGTEAFAGMPGVTVYAI
jgi:hypothetical protein